MTSGANRWLGEGILELGLGGDPGLTGEPLQLLPLLLLPGDVLLFMASEKLPLWPHRPLQRIESTLII